jgi:hypothetical protein
VQALVRSYWAVLIPGVALTCCLLVPNGVLPFPLGPSRHRLGRALGDNGHRCQGGSERAFPTLCRFCSSPLTDPSPRRLDYVNILACVAKCPITHDLFF